MKIIPMKVACIDYVEKLAFYFGWFLLKKIVVVTWKHGNTVICWQYKYICTHDADS